MRAGLLTEEITFLRPTKQLDEYGSEVGNTYTPVITTRARIKYNNGSKVNADEEIFYFYNLEIIIRSYHQIQNDYLIEYKGEKYYIISQDSTLKDQITITAGKYNE